ncbi:MAG: hypothetical protein J7604_06985 [Sporocytophaga sp.]|uniref:HipA family kinase n=1 Tax=Sporocytophaga sp. TaxID=2231183 RepID=UPI001B10B861|nr:HipA family kinase [Sporocytophaga sp.]MBO9699937.1 hypothetical protein [Sporocytophaga sp.]
MLPVYQAISFIREIPEGTTRPWLVNVLVEDKLVPYVVKIFNSKQEEDNQSTVREVLGSVLASEFDLLTPEPALIYFNDQFNDTLPIELSKKVDPHTHKFGCKYMEGAFPINTKSSTNYIIEADTIYGFDNLLFNVDRKRNKANSFLIKNEIYLIDHELCLNFNIDSAINFDERVYEYKKHLFYRDLKDLGSVKKVYAFGTFQTNLKVLNLRTIEENLDLLEDLNHFLPQRDDIINYLAFVKTNNDKFVSYLKRSICE